MTMKLLLGTTALVAALAVSGQASAGPAVTDGDFSNGLTGWTRSGVLAVDPLADTTNGIPADPNGPTNAVYLQNPSDLGFLLQQITLSPNTSYILSYDLFATTAGAAAPGFSIFESAVDQVVTTPELINTQSTQEVPVGQWTSESVTFETTSDPTTTYTLIFGFTSSDAVPDLLLTNVAVPEPVSSAMFGIGVLGLGLVRRMKKAA